MLDFLFAARPGPGLEKQADIIAQVSPTSVVTHPSVFKQLKRKRGQSTPVSSPGQIILQRSPEQRSDGEKATPECPISVAQSTLPVTSADDVESTINKVEQVQSHQRSASISLNNSLPPKVSLAQPQDEFGSSATESIHVKPTSLMDQNTLRDIIESHFNLEILLKHREIRLIEQELGKCQIAYEQIRRCHVIPYPALSSTQSDMFAVSDGSGHTFNNNAAQAPPWGVNEGPYSRHYDTWLISDAIFDERIAEQGPSSPTAGKRLPNRLTRGINADKGIFPSQARLQRGSATPRFQGLPTGQPEVRQEKGPMIVSRKSDGHLVKLVCLDCRRSDFNSVQGFINHCRISHARLFVSHEAAIEASGEELDGDGDGEAPAESSASRGPATAGLVHPMIRAARPPTPDPANTVSRADHILVPALDSSSPFRDPSATQLLIPTHDAIASIPSTPLVPSARAPYLSSLFSRMGHGGDLDAMITDAKQRDEIDAIQALHSDDSSDEETEDPAPQSRSTRGVLQGSVRPASSNAQQQVMAPYAGTARQSASSHLSSWDSASLHTFVSPPEYAQGDTHFFEQESFAPGLATPSNLSPNTTDPYPAPSLVSDDDLDNTHSESDSSSHMDTDDVDDHYMHPQFVDHEELDLGDSSGFNLTQAEKAHGSHVGRRPNIVHEENGPRHVTFANPVRGSKPGRTIAEE